MFGTAVLAKQRNAGAIALLVLVLVALAALQYRWTGELAKADEERASTAIARDAEAVAVELDTEMRRFVAPLAASLVDAKEAELAAHLARLRAQTPAGMIRSVWVIRRSANGERQVLRLDDASSELVASELPPELEVLGGSPAPALLLMAGVSNHRGANARTQGREEQEGLDVSSRSGLNREPPELLVVLPLDPGYLLDRVVAGVVARRFTEDDGYRIEIRDEHDQVLLALGPEPGGKAGPSKVDTRIALMRPMPPFDRGERGPRRTARGVAVGAGPPFDRGASGSGPARPSRAAMAVEAWPFWLAGQWELIVSHAASSLPAAIEHARRRNLAVSFAVLALLATSVGLVLASARGAEAVARHRIQLVAGMSHELFTPVAAVRSAGENLAAGVVVEPEQVRRYGAIVVAEAERLKRLVEQALRWSALQANSTEPPRVSIATSTLIASVMERRAKDAADAGVRLEAEMPPGELRIVGDPDGLESALSNLVDNALKYAKGGGWVGLGARHSTSPASERRVELWVEDRGPGLAERDARELFEPFARGRNVGRHPGSGLGLAIVRQVAEAHGGRARVEQAIPNGARFVLEFPSPIDG